LEFIVNGCVGEEKQNYGKGSSSFEKQ